MSRPSSFILPLCIDYQWLILIMQFIISKLLTSKNADIIGFCFNTIVLTNMVISSEKFVLFDFQCMKQSVLQKRLFFYNSIIYEWLMYNATVFFYQQLSKLTKSIQCTVKNQKPFFSKYLIPQLQNFITQVSSISHTGLFVIQCQIPCQM